MASSIVPSSTLFKMCLVWSGGECRAPAKLSAAEIYIEFSVTTGIDAREPQVKVDALKPSDKS